MHPTLFNVKRLTSYASLVGIWARYFKKGSICWREISMWSVELNDTLSE